VCVVIGAAMVVDSEAGWGVCSFGDFVGLLEHPLINIMAIINNIIRTGRYFIIHPLVLKVKNIL
jgi:hypothetical protein